MEVSKTLQPGEMGTKRFLTQYGQQLVCVRYRINKELKKRYTTIEIIIDEKPLLKHNTGVIVQVKIQYHETDLRQRAKTLGAKWIAEKKVLQLSYDNAKKLGLKNRIVKKDVVTDV